MIKWTLPCAALMAGLLSHVWTVPFYSLKSGKDIPGNKTLLSETFNEDIIALELEKLCGMAWVKLIFFFGFAASQFSMGFLADRYGHWVMLKYVVKALIVSGILITLSGKSSSAVCLQKSMFKKSFVLFQKTFTCLLYCGLLWLLLPLRPTYL